MSLKASKVFSLVRLQLTKLSRICLRILECHLLMLALRYANCYYFNFWQILVCKFYMTQLIGWHTKLETYIQLKTKR